MALALVHKKRAKAQQKVVGKLMYLDPAGGRLALTSCVNRKINAQAQGLSICYKLSFRSGMVSSR